MTTSGHTTKVSGEIARPYKWWVICEVCGPLEWSHDPEEAEMASAKHRSGGE